MNDFVQRTCTEIGLGEPEAGIERTTVSFEAAGETQAYVLLGAPGSGKTTEFQRQAAATQGRYVTARDFLTFDDKAAGRGVTLFIDGLDEMRAGCADGRTPLNAVRAKLARLGCPRFRLSCREADWFGSNDRHHLTAVSPDRSVRVLHLEPLSEKDAEDILQRSYGIDDPGAFIDSARERGIEGMLINPQSLGMLATAVEDNDWPSTRTETFELGCRTLLRELNQEHRIAVPEVVDTAGLMRAAGKLFAVQLLTGAAGYERLYGMGIRGYPSLEDVPDPNREVLRRALRTRLFTVRDGARTLPFHRQVAEFVAARYLADLIAGGLPLGRVLALMTGHDGAVVTDLRGLCAWLAAQSQPSRAEIIARDPLGTILYGDVQGFTRDEKRQILGRLEQSAKDNPWFFRAIQLDSRLRDLVYPGVVGVFRDRTMDSKRDDSRQSFVSLLVEMLAQGKPLEGVAPRLLDIVRDATWRQGIREEAIEAFMRQRGERAEALADLKKLAQDIHAGAVADPDDNLLGSLLGILYPEALSESELLNYPRASKRPDQVLAEAIHRSSGNEAGQRSRRKPAQRLIQRQMQWQALVKGCQAELRENRAGFRLLHQLGKAYLGGFGDVVGRTPRARLSSLLGDDEELIETALAGLRGAVSREELPSDEEVIRLGVQQRMHYLSYPFLAGLDVISGEKPTRDVCLDSDRARLALAMHYNVAVWSRSWKEADGKPRWLPALLKDHATLVADVLVGTARSRLRKSSNFSQHLYDLAHCADHEAVARLASLPILSAFPVRCTERQLPSLRNVLLAACLYCERETLVALIEGKLASRSMNVAQRVYWLAAGLVVRPEAYLARLETYVAGNERRVRQLSQFFSGRSDTPRVLIEYLDVAALSALIRLMGASHRPYSLDSDSDEGAMVTPGLEAADRIHGLINQLSSDSSGDASEHLERLSANDVLIAWRAQLMDAKGRQNAIRRDASFVYAGVKQVVDALNDGVPANAADLAALTLEQLRRTARFIRNGGTTAWREYWNVDPHDRPERPKPENACRDALLSDLQLRLSPLGIDAQGEGTYADDKRADIRVTYGGFNIPVEIKRSCHPDLWSAIRRQLIDKYTRDPGADGHGIYVVFWYGDSEHCRPTPGVRGVPNNAADVEHSLLDDLSAEDRRKISVCLIDVAKHRG